MLLRLLSWPYVRRHRLRTSMTLAGIALGVAVLVAMHTANQSLSYAFRKTVDHIAGRTQLQITAGETGFPEVVLEQVQRTPGVAAAAPVIEAIVNSRFTQEASLLILAVDMTGDRSLRDYNLEDSSGEDVIDDPLIFLAQPDSLIVTYTFAERHRLGRGSVLTLDTMQGPWQFTIRGVMRSGGLASAFGGNLAVMDVYAAQALFGRGRTFDRIDVAVDGGHRVEEVQRELQKRLGPAYQIEPPSARGQQFESLSRVYSLSANVTSLFALFIGMFIIFNTFTIAVAQRRSEIGVLRSLGATRTQIQTLFLAESAVLGLLGSLLGAGLGLIVARLVAAYLAELLGELYGVAQRAEELAADPRLLAFALLAGATASILAAYLPARQAARLDPVLALQKGKTQLLGSGENLRRRTAALALLGFATFCVFRGGSELLFYAGYLSAVTSALLLTPSATLWLSKRLRPLLHRVLPVEGALAADSLIQAPRRTSGTVAALMLSLALVIALAGIARGSYQSIREWMEVAFSPDLFVTTSPNITMRSFRFSPAMQYALKQIPGVEAVQAARTARIQWNGRPVMLVAVDVARVSGRARLPVTQGNPDEFYLRAARAEGVIVSDNFANLYKIRTGDVIDLAAPAGLLRLPVLGVVVDYSDQQGSILLDSSLYRKYWLDDSVNVFRIFLKPGAQPEQVRKQILERFRNTTRVFVLTNLELKRYVLRLTDQWFNLTYVQIAVAVFVAVLGVVNALTVSITDRRRELGVLQAVGALRHQIRRAIWMEALAIAAVGLILGLALGSAQLYYTLEVARRDLAGLRLPYDYPWSVAWTMVAVISAAAFLAAVGPAESAVRSPLVESLQYE